MKEGVSKMRDLVCLLKNRDLSTGAKVGMLKGVIAPTMFYGSEI